MNKDLRAHVGNSSLGEVAQSAPDGWSRDGDGQLMT
jgi:hypothetical protein